MKRIGLILLAGLTTQFCSNERDRQFGKMKECMTWNDPKNCSQQTGVPYQQGYNGSFMFFNNGGWFYPYGSNSYHNTGSIAPSASIMNNLQSQYGDNSNTFKNRINSIRYRSSRFTGLKSTVSNSRSGNYLSRGGFGSSSRSFSSGGRS